MITQTINLNLIPGGVLPRINVSQYDKGARTLQFNLYNGVTPFTIPDGSSVYVVGTKADKTGFDYEATYTGGLVSIDVTEQMTAFAGDVEIEIRIIKSGEQIATGNFVLCVERTALADDTVISETDIPIIQHLPELVAETEENAELAHKWATFGDESEEPSATNNAKYWAEQAAQTDIGQATTVTTTSDTTPYIFHQTTENAVYEKLIGASVVKNQLVTNGDFSLGTDTPTGWSKQGVSSISTQNGVVTFETSSSDGSQLYQSVTTTEGHKLLGCVTLKRDVSGEMRFWFGGGYTTLNVGASFVTYCFVRESTSGAPNVSITDRSYSSGNKNYAKNCFVIDLTLMFGTSIADKVYTMEQATAGSGIAWLKSYGFLSESYIPYNTGTITSVVAEKRVARGFNQWDEEWEVGSIDFNTGAKVGGSSIRTKNYIPVLSNTIYYAKTPQDLYVFEYDANKTFIRRGYAKNTNFGTTDTTRYLLFVLASAYGTAYNHDLCINISDAEKNGTYEPYNGVSYNFGSDTLRGLYTLDGDNLVASGDVKTNDGQITRKYSSPLNLGSLTYTYDATNQRFLSQSIGWLKNITTRTMQIVCDKYVSICNGEAYDSSWDNVIYNSGTQLYIHDHGYTDASAFKTAMNGVYAQLPLATPTTEISTPFASPQVVLDTEEMISPIPVGHEASYVTLPNWMQKKIFDDVIADATKVEDIAEDVSGKAESSALAPVENGATASQPYSVGDYLYRNGTLYRVTSAIASGATFTVDTNITATTVMAEIVRLTQ